MKERNPWHSPATIIITVIGVIAVVALVTVIVLQNREIPQKYKYGIVMDAGSSHTSLYIYRWPAEKENNTGRVEEMHSCQVAGPGISSYASAPWKAGESLRACMREAEQQVPQRRHQQTPLYLGATAGMRLLRSDHGEQLGGGGGAAGGGGKPARVLLLLPGLPNAEGPGGGRLRLGHHQLPGRAPRTGECFQPRPPGDRPPHQTLLQGLETTGALDLGGASTQISFVSDHFDGSESPDNSMVFRLYGNDYSLYTHSFLCYGKDQALRLALAHQTQDAPVTLLDPCFHPGYEASKDYSAVYDSPCVSSRRPQGAPLNFTHKGAGNFAQCQKVIRSIFNSSSCSHSRCSFNGVFQPPLQGKFGAFSAYYFVMDFLNLTDTSLPLETVKRELARYCSNSWDQVKQQHPAVKVKYLAAYCFSGTYIITLLTDGYNFSSESYSSIKFIKKIRGSDAGWTLGYMLNLTNMIPAEAPDSPPLPQAGYASLVTLMVLVLAVVLLLL
ncbi:unnamed protein product, partial [Tetraodon nigroviridis]